MKIFKESSICMLAFHLVIAQFPNHVDFEKVGKVRFKDKTYRILKPTVHVVEDHFKNYVLNQNESTIQSRRIFMDHNGFRHYWNGLDENLESLSYGSLRKNIINTTLTDKTAYSGETKSKNSTHVDTVETNTESSNSTDKQIVRTKKKKKKRKGKTRTLAHTTFFCPYFGVMTVSKYID